MTAAADPDSPDPGLAPDLADIAGGLPHVTGQGDPTPPATPTATANAGALLDQVYRESYDRHGDDPDDGTRDPYRS